MNRHDGASTGRDCSSDERRVDVMGIDIRLNRHRSGTTLAHSQPGGNERIGGNNDLIAWPDTVGTEQQMECVQAIANANAVLDLTIGCKFRLKCRQLRPMMNQPESMTRR